VARKGALLVKGITHVFLALIALIMMAPLLWMLVTSVKSPEEAYRFPPTLIPAVKTFIRDGDGLCQVEPLETSPGDTAGRRVRVLVGREQGKIRTVSSSDIVRRRFMWSNYRDAWNAAPFGWYFINSLLMAGLTTLGQMVTSALAAYAFSRMRFRGKELIFIILLGTMMVPRQVLLIPNYIILSRLGWINTYYALVVPWIAAVFSIYFMRQHFETIPQDLFDAAAIDGCGSLRALFRIVVPLSKGVIVTTGLFTFVVTWNSLLWPLIVTNSPEMRPLQVGLAYFAQESSTEWTLLMAASTFSVLPLILLFLCAQRHIIEGFARSGLKG
jgi:ABC-type glycerol-3-phosphate transport system permease component